MPIWRTIPVDAQPQIILSQWRIVELPDGSRHFNGYVAENREGRVSSPVIEFDPQTLKARTRTGRVYQLTGPTGINSDADYVLNRWLRANELPRNTVKFVTLDDDPRD